MMFSGRVALSRLDRWLPIGPRAKGGPALRLVLASQTYTFNRSCLCNAGAGLAVISSVEPVAKKNQS